MSDKEKTQESDSKKQSSSRFKLLAAILLIVACVAGGVYFFDYVNQQKVREIEGYLEVKDYGAALDVVEDMLAKDPNNTLALTYKARALSRQASEIPDIQRAMPLFKEAMDIYTVIGYQTVEDNSHVALALTHQQQWKSALQFWNLVTGQEPSAQSLFQKSKCQFYLGMYDKSRTTANELIEFDAGSGYFMIGAVETKLGNYQQAAPAFEKAVAQWRETQDTYIPPGRLLSEFGKALLNNGEPEKAIKALEESTAMGQVAETWLTLGTAYKEAGESEKAKIAYNNAITLPDSDGKTKANAVEGWSEIAISEKDSTTAIDFLKDISDEYLTANSIYLLQRAYNLAGETEKAKKLGTKLAEFRQLESARSAMMRTIQNNQESYFAILSKAYVFAEEGNWDQARSIMNELDPEQDESGFAKKLADSVKTQSSLPSLLEHPIYLSRQD